MSAPLIGKSKATITLQKQIQKLSKSRDDVVVIGESGSGKFIAAENLHGSSSDSSVTSPLTVISPDTFSENELVRYLAACSAPDQQVPPGIQDRRLSTHTASGSILIRNIEKMSFGQQRTIAMFIRDRNFRRQSGSSKGADGNRLIVTANDDPKSLAKKNEILQELADELSSFRELKVVPLRERQVDIPYLVQHFLEAVSEKIGIAQPVLDINALNDLMKQPWHGNIRELKSVIERSVLFSPDGTYHLPADIVGEQASVTKLIDKILHGEHKGIDSSLDSIERGVISTALARFNNNLTNAAEFLGMERSLLEKRLVRLGIDSEHR